MTGLVFDRKDVFSWSNAEEARQYIGQEGYFSDICYNDLTLWNKAELIDISCDSDTASVFTEECGDEENFSFGLFLPIDKVKQQEEKKWRPFTLDEFNKIFEIGQVITTRPRLKSNFVTGKWLDLGYSLFTNDCDEEHILLSIHYYTLEDLFNRYEYQDESENWRRFGVEE
jgi:hypothetical protein